MAETKKETVTFLIGDNEEDENSTKISEYTNIEKPAKALHILNDTTCVGKENIRDVNFMDIKEKEHKRRRQSDVCILPMYNPTRGTTYDRYRHNSDTDSYSRRFVLHPSSKVSLEVRRNHSGFSHDNERSNFTFTIITYLFSLDFFF